ncbi:hypothetical protein DFJ74DRAFT_668116 [Hyaloraphidium curvatum]|nr:hypothetical protein DFJ74DRAFT_668116 [Hyaloraphidium curvatum]
MLLGIRGGGVEGALRTAIAAALAFREEEGPADGKAGEDGGDDADPVARSLADLKPGTMAPLKARGLSTLASLLRAEDPRVLKLGTPALAALGIAALADPEEFAYLHAVRFLAALAEADPERGIEALAGAFAGDGDVATRCKVGEVLMRVVVRQGEALGKLGGIHS